MTREEARQNLISIGVTEPTDEQITNYLNQLNGVTKKEREKADKLKADADKIKQLEAQLEELNNANLSDIEKANKATEEANSKIADLEKQLSKMQTMKQLADRGIIGEDAENFFNDDGSVNFDTLSKIISDRETLASANKEKEILKSTPNPEGSGNGIDGEKKPSDVENAEKLVFSSMANDNEKDFYVLGKN